MAIVGLLKGSGKRSRVREKSVKVSEKSGIWIWILSGNPALETVYHISYLGGLHRNSVTR